MLLAITLSCVLLSEVSRVLFFAAAGVLCCYEYSRAVEKLNVYCAAWVMYSYIAAQALLTLFHQGPILYIGFMVIGIYLAMFSGIIHHKVTGNGALYTVAGLAYPGFLFGILMMIGVGEIWEETLLLATAATLVCDTFALFGGMAFGKHKMAPLVSPKKTWEGAISGALSLHHGADRRSGGKPAEADDRREGLLQSDPGPRRHVRPGRQPALLHPHRLYHPAHRGDRGMIFLSPHRKKPQPDGCGFNLSTKPTGFADRGGCSLLRALACGRRSHTGRLRSVFCEVHAPAKHGFD